MYAHWIMKTLAQLLPVDITQNIPHTMKPEKNITAVTHRNTFYCHVMCTVSAQAL